MLTKFWESVGSGLSAKWLEHLFGPAFIFWGIGALIAASQNGWQDAWDWLVGLQDAEKSALLIGGAFLLIVSAAIMQRVQYPLLRLLEGYFPSWLAFFTGRLIQYQTGRIGRKEARWQTLMKVSNRTGREERELARLETDLHYTPADANDIQPTILGNTLRAGEMASTYKFGLDAVVCWSRLWLLLPEKPREDLSQARQTLDEYVSLWLWGALSLAWMSLTPWAGLLSLAWMAFAYDLAVQSARVFTDLLAAAFDLHRHDLYESLHWPPPKTTAEEKEAGQKLTEFLWRGTTPEPVVYVTAEKGGKEK